MEVKDQTIQITGSLCLFVFLNYKIFEGLGGEQNVRSQLIEKDTAS